MYVYIVYIYINIFAYVHMYNQGVSIHFGVNNLYFVDNTVSRALV